MQVKHNLYSLNIKNAKKVVGFSDPPLSQRIIIILERSIKNMQVRYGTCAIIFLQAAILGRTAITEFPPPQFSSLLPGFADPDSCSDQVKVIECFAKMHGGGGDSSATAGPPIGMGFAMNLSQFTANCKAADTFANCIDGYHIRDECAKDPLFVQLDGTIGYMCREPQKTGKFCERLYGGKGNENGKEEEIS